MNLRTAVALTLFVQLCFWTPMSIALFVPSIQEVFERPLANLIGLYVGILPILIFLVALMVGAVEDK